jgi:hypothetical protein
MRKSKLSGFITSDVAEPAANSTIPKRAPRHRPAHEIHGIDATKIAAPMTPTKMPMNTTSPIVPGAVTSPTVNPASVPAP